MRKNLSKLKADNSGVALVMVIVVIGFVSIIATVLLYMSAMNFYMKTTDQKIKNGFYDGEKAMEQIRADLIICAEQAFDKAYAKAMQQYANSDASTCQAIFDEEFASEIETIWQKRSNLGATAYPSSGQLKIYLESVIDSKFDGKIKVNAGCPGGMTGSIGSTTAEKKLGKLTISNVQIEYKDANGYTTIISTDFIVKSPKISFDGNPDGVEKNYIADSVYYANWLKE